MPVNSKAKSVAVSSRPASRSTISTSRGIEFLEGAGPEVLAPDNQTVSLPEEDLDVIAVAIDKQEEVTQEWILAKVLAPFPKRPSKLLTMSVGGVQKKDSHGGGELRGYQVAFGPGLDDIAQR